MQVENVEIYSKATNMAIIRHPGRRFPGVLVQGDTLNGIVSDLKQVLAERNKLPEDAVGELEGIYDRLSYMLEHYTLVLRQNGMELPFPHGSES
ncbi:MAG: hypothetical protein EA353_12465 [Puniceicoccaceae bacterium]|nr:MAG: hypothetical protein EA353_12465 [Puniceicoccaceae bacterium]